MSRILLLGCDGMLGSALRRVLGADHEIMRLARADFDIESGAWGAVPVAGHEYVLNAAGLINKRQAGADQFFTVNAVFPQALAGLCGRHGAKLIHFSTDCVFAGVRAPHFEDSATDADDLYGRTKRLGEPVCGMTIRTSIIGPESRNGYNLMCWALRQREMQGYTNVRWNGMTTVALAQAVGALIERNLYVSGVRHLYSTDLTKFDVLGMICSAFGNPAVITPAACATARDMRLRTRFPEWLGQLNIPPLGVQLAALAQVSHPDGSWRN